eukprot:CAMPEP_0194365494 /NCGR_PEP_ID=MMETSP0174-20130528/13556_1 /TAXON_ID=216777 /ORGANISM="Proboscia alata, Strain PI-D3" /LENGTH=156 /DNA_ID=CAMNT_0039140219 /DNA_START=453 /DNA_END=920 /DNA_ORIENTATION=+
MAWAKKKFRKSINMNRRNDNAKAKLTCVEDVLMEWIQTAQFELEDSTIIDMDNNSNHRRNYSTNNKNKEEFKNDSAMLMNTSVSLTTTTPNISDGWYVQRCEMKQRQRNIYIQCSNYVRGALSLSRGGRRSMGKTANDSISDFGADWQKKEDSKNN